MAGYSNAFAIATAIRGGGMRTGARVFTITRLYTLMMQARVKANASGRPGPRIITGDYNRSISGQVEVTGGSVVGIVSSLAPQAARLEYGFDSEDSRGRRYSQPPYAHFGPGFDAIAPMYEAAIAKSVGF